jgi:chromosomal replication initiation ATPase DnaA
MTTPREHIGQLLEAAYNFYRVVPCDRRRRFQSAVRARDAVVVVLLRRSPKRWNNSAIGRLLGRDHSSIQASRKRIPRLLKYDPKFIRCVQLVTEYAKGKPL